jgi:predicted ATPase
VRAEHQTALDLGEHLMRLAEGSQDSGLLVEACWARGATLFWLGQSQAARADLERGVALYVPKQHSAHALIYGQDPGVASLSYLGWTLGLLGHTDQALKRVQEAVTLAEAVAHPFSLGFGLHCGAIVHALRGEGRQAQERTDAELALSNKHSFPFWATGGTAIQGWALADQGQFEAGIAQLRQGFAGWLGTGAELARTYYLGLLADACRMARQADAGLAAVTEALAAAEKTDERFNEAELYRLKGELLLLTADQNGTAQASAEAEACFRQAQHRQLADVVQGLSEGLETPDLQTAKELLKLGSQNGIAQPTHEANRGGK